MSIEVTIAWGESPDEDSIQTYTFDSIRDADHFLWGVKEGNGWLDYTIIGGDIKDEKGETQIFCDYDGTKEEYLIALEEGRA